jgi:hypothetical protein
MTGLRIDVGWSDGAIASVGLHADLPKASQVLAGRTPDEALGMLGLLYAVCGRAQRAAAELALCAAGGPTPSPEHRAELERGVAAEAVVEHLWRLLVDWPRKLGIDGVHGRFAFWYRRVAANDADWTELERELADVWLGAPVARLEAWGALSSYDAWLATSVAPLARMLAALRAADATTMRASAAGDARARPMAATQFGAGRVRETGAVDQYADHPWIRALLGAGRGLEARVAARLVAAVALVGALARPSEADAEIELDATSPAARCGRAAVQTARGMLVHDVRLEGDRIVSYTIRTPTECNFADDGAYRALLARRGAVDRESAQRLADLWALALDPCVQYAVHVAGPDAGAAADVTPEAGHA